jgi:hypothetical protein
MIRRPLAVVILGLLFIITGAAGLLRDWLPILSDGRAHLDAELAAEGTAMLTLIWSVRALAVAGGVGLIGGRRWARPLLVVWMLFHIGVGGLHSAAMLLTHVVIFALLGWLLFRPSVSAWLVGGTSMT